MQIPRQVTWLVTPELRVLQPKIMVTYIRIDRLQNRRGPPFGTGIGTKNIHLHTSYMMYVGMMKMQHPCAQHQLARVELEVGKQEVPNIQTSIHP